jgi:hypothetical protein
LDLKPQIKAYHKRFGGYLESVHIEGKFGQGKRRFSLSKIMCKLADTSASAIAF